MLPRSGRYPVRMSVSRPAKKVFNHYDGVWWSRPNFFTRVILPPWGKFFEADGLHVLQVLRRWHRLEVGARAIPSISLSTATTISKKLRWKDLAQPREGQGSRQCEFKRQQYVGRKKARRTTLRPIQSVLPRGYGEIRWLEFRSSSDAAGTPDDESRVRGNASAESTCGIAATDEGSSVRPETADQDHEDSWLRSDIDSARQLLSSLTDDTYISRYAHVWLSQDSPSSNAPQLQVWADKPPERVIVDRWTCRATATSPYTREGMVPCQLHRQQGAWNAIQECMGTDGKTDGNGRVTRHCDNSSHQNAVNDL